MPDATTTYYAARPVLKVNGTEEQGIADELLSLLVEETTDGLFRCEAKLSNWGLKDGRMDFLWLDRALLDFGAELEVELGPPERHRRVFKGRITALEAAYPADRPPELTVLAEDALQDLRMTRRTRSFENVTDGDVVQQIASAHGLQAEVGESGPQHAVLTQVNQSDLAFLRERAAAVDALLVLEDARLRFLARAGTELETIELRYGAELREVTALADLAHQRSKVRVTGWDVASKSGIRGEADDAAIGAELAGLTGGAAVLTQSLAARTEQLAHLVPMTQDEADALARARFREIARRFVTATATTEGDGRLRVGAVVSLAGLGSLFDGDYAVTAARHAFQTDHGYRCTLDIQRAGLGS